MHNHIIYSKKLCKYFQVGPEEVHILKGVDFEMTEGQTVAITGKSGSGKSTLLNLFGALDQHSSGELILLGKQVEHLSEEEKSKMRNANLGFVYQFHHLLKEFSALENVAMPLIIGGVSIAESKQSALDKLKLVGLEQRQLHKPAQLSGGERQRIAIARALVCNPKCVLMDEPTGNLDEYNTEIILDLIDQVNKQFNMAFIVVTHDANVAQRMQQTLNLSNGILS